MTRGLWTFAIGAIGGIYACHAEVLAQTNPCEWQLEETLGLGSVGGEVVLSPLYDLDVGPDGRIYTIQSWDYQVLLFQPDGRPAGQIGRAGSGPGEFAAPPRRLGWLGDTLWVSERFTTHFFHADGTPVRQVSFRIPMDEEGSVFAPGTPLTDGTFLPWRSVTDRQERFMLARRAPLRRLSASGEIVDTVATIERHLVEYTIHRENDSRGFGMLQAHPLAPSTTESWLPVVADADGSAVVFIGNVQEDDDQPTFDLLRIDIAGDTLLHRAVPYVPLPVTGEERELMRERFAAAQAGDFTPDRLRPPWGTRDAERRRQIAGDAITFPALHPPVRRIVTGSDRSIWLLREAWPRPSDLWEVYDEAGNLEGSVRLEETRSGERNSRLYVFHASRRQVWGQISGALDVPHLYRYDVRRGCG